MKHAVIRSKPYVKVFSYLATCNYAPLFCVVKTILVVLIYLPSLLKGCSHKFSVVIISRFFQADVLWQVFYISSIQFSQFFFELIFIPALI